mmetsp:Transcript_10305/g.20645  ORF Transcript_10305/g.20645 Transcript_10305/m.20645 type:complete len:544 (+) Transcript_10305:1449-3080(+)
MPSLSPTSEPSLSPSSSPSALPSSIPSSSPTVVPSASPSESPTSIPSASPSSAPTSSPSVSPSSSPTPYAKEYSTGVYIRLVGISSTLDGPRESIFEETAKIFVSESMISMDDVDVEITDAQVVTQSVTSFGPNGDNSDLLIELDITGTVHPYKPPSSFSFPATVLNGFVRSFTDFTDALYESSDFFEPLGHTGTPGSSEIAARVKEWEKSTSNSSGDSTNNVGIAVGASVAALVIALSIGVVVKRNRDAAKEEASLGSLSNESAFEPYGAAPHEGSLPSLPLSPASPNTLEGGKQKTWDFRQAMSPDVQSDQYSKSGGGSLLSWKSKATASSKDGAAARQLGLSMSVEEELIKARLSQGLASPGAKDDNRNPTPLSVPDTDSYSFGQTAEKQLALTTVPLDNRYPMSVGQQYLQRDQHPEGRDDTNTTIENNASPIAGSHSMSQFGLQPQQMRRELYDCYAPPGPLGIVIDTTPEGPMVHSLKPTSKLSGLLQPGDLVVGLDDIDTRGMTAATLTRLMAKRSQQAQRKITLLSARTPSEIGE